MPSQISSGEDKAKQATEARKLELEHRLQKVRAEKPQIQGGNNGKDNNSNETAVVGKPRRRLSARDKKRELEHMFLDKTDKSCPSFDESSHSQSKNDLSKSQHSHSILKRRSPIASCTTLEKGGSDHSILNRRSSFTGAATTTKHHDRNATTKSCVSFADDSVGEIRPQLLLERKHASFRQDTNMDLTSKSCGSLTRKHSVQRSTSAPSRGNVQRSRSHPNLGRHQLQLQRSSSSRRNLVHPPSRRLSSSQHHPDASRRSARSMQSAIEEAKPAVAKSLVLIWVLMACELGFDLGTTVIAFMALTEDDDCCGYELTSLSMAVIITTPFLLLVCAELVLLTRIITQTMYRTVNVPSHGSDVFLDNISDMESEEFGSFYDSDQEDRKDDDVTAKITTKEHDPETGGLKQQEMRKAGDDTGGSISLIGKDPTFSSKNISPSNRQTKSSSACSGFVSQDDGIALNDQVSVKKQAKLKQEVTVPDMNQVKEGNVIVQTKQSEEETAKESTASDVQKDQEKLDTHAATIQSSSSNDVVRKSFCTPCCGCWDIEIVFRYLEILVSRMLNLIRNWNPLTMSHKCIFPLFFVMKPILVCYLHSS